MDAFEHRIPVCLQPVGFAEQQFKFRAGELTLVNGVNGHGKTELVGHIALMR
jgi:twinkle protein